MNRFSNYVRGLPEDVYEQYKNKIEPIRVDPYSLLTKTTVNWKTLNGNPKDIPEVKEIDITDYFIHGASFYTSREFRAKKSLEAYNFFVSSHITELKWLDISDYHIVIAKVKHSLKMNEDQLTPWVLFERSGGIAAAHCTCMAGLAECCSHVAAVCFCLEYFTLKKEGTAVTDVPAYWVVPGGSAAAFNTIISRRQIEKISFVNAKNKKVRKQLQFEDGCNILLRDKFLPKKCDKRQILDGLFKLSRNAKLLKVSEPHSNKLAEELHTLPKSLKNLFKDENEDKSLEDLVEMGKNLKINISEEDSRIIEETTRQQSKCNQWFIFRSGRITASRSHTVCRAMSMDSNISVIRSICYPESSRIKVAATEWGCKHEKQAIAKYIQYRKKHHECFAVIPSGFYVSVENPFLGASPDSIVQCKCCGKGVLEVKCPHCLLVKSMDDLKYLDVNTGERTLIKNHIYYYQMQTQLICINDAKYADFFIWSKEECHFERVLPDPQIQQEIIEKSKKFFFNAILPELLGKYYTNRSTKSNTAKDSIEDTSFPICYCRDGNMKGKTIACTMEGCNIVIYHYKCIGITRFVKKFVCDECAGQGTSSK